MIQLGIATSNIHKLKEFKKLLSPIEGLRLVSHRDFPGYTPPEENHDSFEGNASAKALHFAQAIGSVCLADDSGLVVPALNGEPGVLSARYAKPDAKDFENRQKLIQAITPLPERDRQAYFCCALALASPEKLIKVTVGNCEGFLILEEKGRNGFGYDPIFIKQDYHKTFAELDEDLKNRISHRRKAFDKMLLTLELLIKSHALSH